MALIKKLELSNGIVCEKAYIKIFTISGGKYEMSFQTQAFINKEAYLADRTGVGGYSYTFKPNMDDSTNFIAQAYTFLKGLPDFKDAIDD